MRFSPPLSSALFSSAADSCCCLICADLKSLYYFSGLVSFWTVVFIVKRKKNKKKISELVVLYSKLMFASLCIHWMCKLCSSLLADSLKKLASLVVPNGYIGWLIFLVYIEPITDVSVSVYMDQGSRTIYCHSGFTQVHNRAKLSWIWLTN